MTQIETLKAQAKNLKHAMTKMGMPISLAQALEAVAQQYGMDNWDTLAGTVNKGLAGVPYKFDFVVPQMVKSAKDCQLIILTSVDGSQYDRHVIVPPHLKAELISAKIKEEILRLKQIDRVLEEEDENYVGSSTDADLARYAASLGCLWVTSPEVCGENWD